MMIWHLTLNQDPDTGAPTTYTLHSAYGMAQPRTTGIAGGGIKLDLEGRWTILRGTQAKPDAVVYQLNPDNSALAIYFVRLDENILYVLTQERELLLGTAAWSYTLNRTSKRPEDQALPPTAFPSQVTLPPTVSTGTATNGVFEGRMLCIDIVYEFTQFPPNVTCELVKWRLFLYQDPDTGAPTTYRFYGTRTDREGTWARTLGTRADPQGIVYQLYFGEVGRFLSFLKADENHLFLLDAERNLVVGNALWSYTLSRKE